MKRIRKLRNKKNLSGPDMAAMLNITPTQLYDIERGRRRIHGELLSDIANILETSTDYLLNRTDNPTLLNTTGPDWKSVWQAPDLGDAIIRIKNICAEFSLTKETFLQMVQKAVDKYGLPGLPPDAEGGIAAHGPREPGSGILNGEDE